ncbi:hypothetical protein QJS04_geneDACA013916 [Acorus gramineus]|uniref:Protein KAKU4 n=1 Tax=Acorus gramineus TaxID=55184 RepID=A0AAV9AZF7_ACOGR|nr:hypothetical protein QJS04_geneDACA013916 [Acorus gramineus]
MKPFVFGSRRAEEPGSGGKAVSSRSRLPPASPYSRSEPRRLLPRPRSPSPSPPPSPNHGGRLFGLIAPATKMIAAGAGKLFSSVFGSSEELEDESDIGSEDENVDMYCEENEESSQRHGTTLIEKNHLEGPQSVAQKRDAKILIEQLILQETFTREECNRLTKIIQSRVRNISTMEGSRKSADISAGRSFISQLRSQGLTSYSIDGLTARSPLSSALLPSSAAFTEKAVKDAKKWVTERKLASSSKSDLELGPCILNTCASPHMLDDGVSSPADMAKSYMESLPPWQSPSLSNSWFGTPPSTGMHLYNKKDTIPFANLSLSLPSSKALKRIVPSDVLDECRRLRGKPTENEPETPVLKQIESSVGHEENNVCPDAVPSSNAKSVEVDLPMMDACNKTDIYHTTNGSEERQETVNDGNPGQHDSSLTAVPSEANCTGQGLNNSSVCKGSGEGTLTQSDISATRESLLQAYSVMEHDNSWDIFEDLLAPEPDSILSNGTESVFPSDADNNTKVNVNRSIPGSSERKTIQITRSRDAENQSNKDVSGPEDHAIANESSSHPQSSMEVQKEDTVPHQCNDQGDYLTISSHGELAANTSESNVPLSESPITGGSKLDIIEAQPLQNLDKPKDFKRGKKVVAARYRRGRGRGRGKPS